ncbi:hypothetical protein Tco_0307063 [Tanacetum coccineum]
MGLKFLATANAKTVNGEHQIQALVDKKKVIINEKSVRSDPMLDDAEGTECLPNDHLEGEVKFIMYLRFVQVFLDKQVEGMTRHKEVYVTPSHTKKVFANMKRPGQGFSGRVTPLFPTMMVQAPEDMGEDSSAPSYSHSSPIISQPSSSKPQKKKSMRKHMKDSGPTEPVTNEAHVSTPSYDRPQSGEDSMQLSKLMNLCTSLQEKVLDFEKAKTTQAKEIASLKKRVKQLERRRKLRTPGLKRLSKVGSTSSVESSNDVILGDQEDASKHGRKITDLDADAEVTLVDETQEMNDDNLMFDTYVLEEQEKEVAEKEVSTADPITTAGEVVTTANVEATTANAPTTTIDELTLDQTLIEIKAGKPKAVTSAATTTTTTRPKAKGVVKDKGKTIMVEPERPLKKKDQVSLDKEMARNLEAQMQAELIEEERFARQKEEEANIALIESWDNTRKKHFAKLRAEEIRRKPPTKAQKRNQMSIYLKNMAGYKHSQLKSKSYDDEIRRKPPTTPLSDANEDECFDPGGKFDEIKGCLTSDSISPGIDGADFDPEGDILILKKLLNDDISFSLPLKELHFEGLNIPSDSEEFLDRNPRSLEDEPDKNDLKGIIMSVQWYLNSFHLFICVLPLQFPSINSAVTPFSPLIEVKDSTTQSLDFLFLLSTTNDFGSRKASFIGGLWSERLLTQKFIYYRTYGTTLQVFNLLDIGNTDKNSSFYDESIISESTSRNASMEAVSPSVFQSHVPRRSVSLQLRVNKPPLPNNTRVKR